MQSAKVDIFVASYDLCPHHIRSIESPLVPKTSLEVRPAAEYDDKGPSSPKQSGMQKYVSIYL
jgi:hypothetical protein